MPSLLPQALWGFACSRHPSPWGSLCLCNLLYLLHLRLLVLHSLHRISVGVQSSECVHYYGCFLLRALGS